MKQLEAFRIYYNHTLHPELLRLERSRIRLIRLMFASLLLITGILFLQQYLNILLIALILIIPITVYMGYLAGRIRDFKLTFKPHIMNLILDFIDEGVNYGALRYHPKKYIEKERFLASRIFDTKAPYYFGEDFIEGQVGSIRFELCELRVREYSRVRSRLNYVFNGIFLHATFPESLQGTVIIWPTEYRKFLSRSIKAFTWDGGKKVELQSQSSEFNNHFIAYAGKDTTYRKFVSQFLEESITNYRRQTGKEIYLSFINNEIYAAVTEPKDILEPYIFRSNLSFELVREFFEDIHLVLNIVEDFDRMH